MDQPGIGDAPFVSGQLLVVPWSHPSTLAKEWPSSPATLRCVRQCSNVPTIIHFPNQPTQLQKAWVLAWLTHNLYWYESKTGAETWDGLVFMINSWGFKALWTDTDTMMYYDQITSKSQQKGEPPLEIAFLLASEKRERQCKTTR